MSNDTNTERDAATQEAPADPPETDALTAHIEAAFAVLRHACHEHEVRRAQAIAAQAVAQAVILGKKKPARAGLHLVTKKRSA